MAGIISQETIEAVNNSSDIVSVIGEYVQLENRGSQFWGCCPFHNEKTPSFSVNPERNMYYCFGCHAGGGVINFIMEMEKIKFPEAVSMLARKAGIEIKYTGNQTENTLKPDNTKDEYIKLYTRVADMFHYGLMKTQAGRFAFDYILKRGITEETLEKFKLGYAPADRRWLKTFLKSKNFSEDFLNKSGLFSKKYPDFAFFSDRLMFPIFDRRGGVVAFGGRFLRGDPEKSPKYLNSGDLIQYQKGQTLYAFNFAKNSIRTEKKVIFCEGYMDCIAYHQCGITYAVAPLGTALTDDQIKIVRSFVEEIYLSFDSDGAGQAATQKAIFMCRRQGLIAKVIKLHGGKDPAEIMINHGKENLTKQVNSAIMDSDYLLDFLAQKFPIETPDGRTKAALEFFPYIDALQTDIQKESCLEKLGQKFNISLESINRDYHNREQASRRIEVKRSENQAEIKPRIKLNAELRAILAVISDTNQFELMNAVLTEEDFEDPVAKKLFIILKKCLSEGNLSFNGVLSHCEDENLQRTISGSVASGEFSENTVQSVSDSVRLIKRNSLERQRNILTEQIEGIVPDTEEKQLILTRLLTEKMNIDNKLDSKEEL